MKVTSLLDVAEDGDFAEDGQDNLIIKYNAATKSYFGEVVSCFNKSIDGLKGGQKLCIGFIVLSTMVMFMVSIVFGYAFNDCIKHKKKHHC